MQGLRDLAVGLRHGEGAAVVLALRLLVGQALYVAGTVHAVRRRRWDWLLALGGCALLPVVWNNMYGYAKFYLLFAVLAARLPARVGLAVVGVLGLLNVSALAAELHAGRVTYALRADQYRAATSGTAWIAAGWDPDLVYRWPGSKCAMLRSFMAPPRPGATADEIRGDTSVEFMACVERAFCGASAVWTGDWGTPSPVYAFSAERQAQVCAGIREFRERAGRGVTSPGSGRRGDPAGLPSRAAHVAGIGTGAGLGETGESATRPTATLYRPTPGHR